MKAKHLKAVPDVPSEVIDITSLMRADIPDREHWRVLHERDRKNVPVDLPERVGRVWR